MRQVEQGAIDMRISTPTIQSVLFGTAAAGVSAYGASAPGVSDRARITSSGMAAIFAGASYATGFKVWGGINVGIVAGTLGALALTPRE